MFVCFFFDKKKENLIFKNSNSIPIFMKNKTKINNFALQLFEGMQRDNLNYIYRGSFSQSITDGILSLTESNDP